MKKEINPSEIIAAFVKAARLKVKMTQEQFAERYNCSKGNISGWEQARHKPSYEQLWDMASFSGLPLPNTIKKDFIPPNLTVVENISKKETISYLKPDTQEVEIKKYNEIAGAMGSGLLLRELHGEITNIRFTKEWGQQNLPSNTGLQNLCVVTGFGDSMLGMFNSGDPLVVDTGVREIKFDGAYFFRIGDEGFIKKLQRIPGQGIRVISINKEYESWTITEDMDFEVLGKVLIVWESRKF